jgi:uncharacterized protein YjiK
MKLTAIALVIALFAGLVSTSTQSFAEGNNYYLTIHLKNSYIQGETVRLSGTVTPFKEDVPLIIEILDPSTDVYFAAEVHPERSEEDIGLYSYELKLTKDAPVGIWGVNAKYASKYMLYDKQHAFFRVSDSLDILALPPLKINIDGVIDSSSEEWAQGYDLKYWKPFAHNPSKIEGNVAFNAYYSDGVLYAVFDVPDKKFDSKDFVEIGLDIDNAGERFRIGDDVYVFRIFRDGTHDSFRLGTESAGEKSTKHHFSAKSAEAGDIRVQVFDTNGNLVKVFNSLRDTSSTWYKGMLGIAGLEVDKYGNLYVLDSDSGRVSKFDPNGRLLGSFGAVGTSVKEFIDPTGIALDSKGNIYVADTGNARVQRFDELGRFMGMFGSMGLLSLGLMPSNKDVPDGEHYIAFDNYSHAPIGVVDADLIEEHGVGAYIMESGKVWKVLHIFNDTIYVKQFNNGKDSIPAWTPDGIVVDPFNNIYIVDRENGIAKKFDSDGRLVLKWGSSGKGDGEFSKPTAMDIDSENNVYIVDTGNNRIQRFDSNGKFIATWGGSGNEAGRFNDPRGIAIDDNDNVFVLDNGNSRVQKFDKYGNFITQWGSTGSSVGQFDNLSTEGLAVDSKGMVYVADLPGQAKATHWIAEVAIPISLEDTFGIYLAQGTYGDHGSQVNSEEIYDVYRNTWPKGAILALPETWAKARLIDHEEVKVQPTLSIENVRSCKAEVCKNWDYFDSQLNGKIIVTASVAVEQPPEKFHYERAKVTLQYSIDDDKWIDVDSKFVTVSKDVPSVVNLEWTPFYSGDVKLRVTSSGFFTQSMSDLLNLKVKRSDSLPIRGEVKMIGSKAVQKSEQSLNDFKMSAGGFPTQSAFDIIDSILIRVIDPDMNINPDTIDTLQVRVWSTTDRGGLLVTLRETGDRTGIFEEILTFTLDEESTGTRLRVSEGDTITAKYSDKTLPAPAALDADGVFTVDVEELFSHALIGGLVPPLERAVVSEPELLDVTGKPVAEVDVGSQILVQSQIANQQNKKQPFAYIVQIKDEFGVTGSLSWVTGELQPKDSFKAAQSWIPDAQGIFSVEIFVWESIDSPNALSPVRTGTIELL